MTNRVFEINVKGTTKNYSFDFDGDPQYLPEWRAQGLDINPVLNIIPRWAVDIGLLRIWCFFQDVFRK